MRVAIKGRPDRIAAALLLTALVACLSLLAHPSGKADASASSAINVSASLRYGCATPTTDPFVEVTLKPGAHTVDPNKPQVVQVGLADASTADGSRVFASGGPNLVSLDAGTVTIRLAGPPAAGDHVFIRQVDQPDIITIPLPASCGHLNMTDFGLTDPDVVVSHPGCSGSQANLKITVTNPNAIDDTLTKLGVQQLDYTVLLVRSDGLLSGAQPTGQLVTFTEPGAESVNVTQVAALPASYQVRVIAPDGTVDTVGNKRLSCDSAGHPGPPTSSVTPTPIKSSPSSTPTTSSSSPAPTSHSASKPPVASKSPTATRTSAARTSSNPGVAPASSPDQGAPNSEPVLGDGDATSQAAIVSNSHKPSAKPSARPSPTTHKTIADPPTRLVSAFRLNGLFSGGALLIVLVFLLSLSGLVGTTVVNARRR